MMARGWPYLVERPGRGQVRACPLCGDQAVFNCWHEDEAYPRIRTIVMNAYRAAWLRRTSGRYDRAMEFVCAQCGHSGPFESGMTVGTVTLCAACSGRTVRQVEAARRAVR